MNLISFFQSLPWWVPIPTVFGVNIFFYLLARWLYKHFYPKIESGGHHFLSLILKILYRPMQALLWILGLSIMVSLYAGHFFEVELINLVKRFLTVGAIFCIAWTAYLFSRELERTILLKRQYDTTTIELFSKLSLIVIILLTLLLVLPLFGVQVAGLLAFGGLGGLMVGYAARDALSNLLGGIVMAIDRPFRIGDWIYSIDQTMEGVVEHIGWRMTVLRQFDKRPLFIPNQTFSNLTFVNASRMTNRRIQKVIRLRYLDGDKMMGILEEIRTYINQHPDLDHSQTNYVHFTDMAESSLSLTMRAYTKTVIFTEYLRVTEEVLFGIFQIIRKHEAQVALQTSTVHLHSMDDLSEKKPPKEDTR